MPRIMDDEHRAVASEYAIKWGADPEMILWEGALMFKQLATDPPEFAWVYKEFVLDDKGRRQREGDGVLTVRQQRPIPEEWIEEYEAAVHSLYESA